MTSRRPSSATPPSAGPRPRAPPAWSRRRSARSPRGSASSRSGRRWPPCASTATRSPGRAGGGGERRPLGVSLGEGPRARRGDGLGDRQAPAARADAPAQGGRHESGAPAGAARPRAVRARGAGRGRAGGGPPAPPHLLSRLRVGTRGSALALAQSTPVAEALGAELVTIRTTGDRGAGVGDKARWVKELEAALLSGEIDLAVHSAKDVPGEIPDGLAIVAAPPRGPSEDVLCGAPSLAALPPGARVGTSSLRRAAQLRAARDDLDVQEVHGNVDTRLRKLADGEQDALVLARAGLARLGREEGAPLPWVPAPGQGTLALEGRAGDDAVTALARAVADPAAEEALRAERTVAAALGASCHSAFGAHAARPPGGGPLRRRTWIGAPDGGTWIADELDGEEAEALALTMAERLRTVGAVELLG